MKVSLFIRALFWTLICPGTVALLGPWCLLRGKEWNLIRWDWVSWLAAAAILTGAGVLFWCIAAFAVQGKGTLSPADPAKRLVVKGLYRYVRNPMYVGVTTILFGEAFLLKSMLLFGYAILVFILFNLFIRLHEEPYLRRQFGAEYEQYCRKVRRWLPGKAYES